MNWLHTLWSFYTQFAKESPVVASIVSVSAMGVATFFLRTVPKSLWSTFKQQISTSLTFDNSSDGSAEELFLNVMHWYDTSPWSRFGRTLRVYSGWLPSNSQGPDGSRIWSSQFRVGFGGGLQFGLWEGLPVTIRRTRLSTEASVSNRVLYEITITRLGRNRESLKRLLESFLPVRAPGHKAILRYSVKDQWKEVGRLRKRSLDSVVTKTSVKTTITNAIDQFLERESWYLERGIPYKLCIMLRGTPGCGKTSLIRALASHYGKALYLIQLNSMSDETLRNAFSTTGPDGFVVLEDFNISSLLARNDELKVATSTQHKPTTDSRIETEHKEDATWCSVTLQGFLNVFDGLEDLHGKIIFLTTNVYDELDAAVVRKGRVDLSIEMLPLEHPEIVLYLMRVFKEQFELIRSTCECVRFTSISGAELQALYIEHSEDPVQLVSLIPQQPQEGVKRLYG